MRPPLPPPYTSERIVVELDAAKVGMFRFLLEAYENVAYFTVVDRHIARLAVIFSPHCAGAARQALDEIGQSLPMRVLPTCPDAAPQAPAQSALPD